MTDTLEHVCKTLLDQVEASVIGIAQLKGEKIKWTHMLKPLNEKSKRMEISYGSGVAGTVMKTGQVWYCPSREDLPLPLSEYPIILAENLQSFIAIPLMNDRLFGSVLLIGYRQITPLPLEENWINFKEDLSRILTRKEASL
ncbi:GAF domain-containing protein [Halobacillus fulvus]|nr:GAF domain-containing protein [Halobacillus fulvus]